MPNKERLESIRKFETAKAGANDLKIIINDLGVLALKIEPSTEKLAYFLDKTEIDYLMKTKSDLNKKKDEISDIIKVLDGYLFPATPEKD